MVRKAILFLTLLLVTLPAGRAFWVWVADNPAHFSAAVYVAYFQGVDRAIELPIAVMGAAAVVLTAIAGAFSWRDRPVLYLLLAALGCLLVTDFVTVFVNVPINHQIANFNPVALPANWPALRDRWWAFHQLRLVALLGAMSFVFLAVVLRMPPSCHSPKPESSATD